MRTPRLYLASASPRRRELLEQLQLGVLLLPQEVDESRLPGELPEAYVLRVAAEKARAALQDPGYDGSLPVLAADTSVVCEGLVLGKPADSKEALGMLRSLSGRQHQVLTAVVVATATQCRQQLVRTTVSFRALEEEELLAYWNTGEPRDKAGAYAIQGLGALFVDRIEGSYSGVVGLPLFETMQLLAQVGITVESVLKRRYT
ncbi:MAG TPA: septum formation inhibitor Maf [Pseudomonadaceae bacterium]|nr:septum formation inhibitor Maf [Pseudomonadaceae bacterium]